MTVRLKHYVFNCLNFLKNVFLSGSHNDARMCLSIAITAARMGATLGNHVKVTELVKDDDGKVVGAKMADQLTGEEWTTKV